MCDAGDSPLVNVLLSRANCSLIAWEPYIQYANHLQVLFLHLFILLFLLYCLPQYGR